MKKAIKKKVFKKKVFKKKVRSHAERSAAAKASWERRRAEQAAKAMDAAPDPAITAAKASWERRRAEQKATVSIPYREFMSNTARPLWAAPDPAITAAAVQEGSDLFVVIGFAGSLFRHKLTNGTARKLGLDLLQLVG